MMIIEQMLKNAQTPLLHIADVSGSALFLGDCLEIMCKIPKESIDFICCDLPYGVTAMEWDKIIPMDKLWEQYERIIKPNGAIALFSQGIFTHKLALSNEKLYRYQWVWVKNQPSGITTANIRPMRNHEDILVFYKKQPTYNKQLVKSKITDRKTGVSNGKLTSQYSATNGIKQLKKKDNPENIMRTFVNPRTVLEYNVPPMSKGRLHQNQKPIDLIEMLIKTYTNENDLVLDNTAGSGTTCLAAKELNRKFIGIEKEPKYYEIACQRCGF